MRPVGTSDAQPHGHGVTPQFFWQWTPVNLPARSLFFHINADRHGAPWNTRAVIAPDGAGHDGFFETPAAAMDSAMQPGTRWPAGGTLTIQGEDGPLDVRFEPLVRFQMKGLGYTSPKWGHGLYHGPLVVEREDMVLDAVKPMAQTLDIAAICLANESVGGAERLLDVAGALGGRGLGLRRRLGG